MPAHFRKILFNIIFNSSLFLTLFIGIQNSYKKINVSFFKSKSTDLPISFIIGTSFISGSIVGSFISLNFLKKDK